MANRRGFTLIEIMISLTIMLMVMGAVYRLMIATQRVSRGQAERVNVQSNVRIGSLVVLNDLRELNTVTGGGTDQNDILAIGASEITYRGMRGIGFICQAPTATEVRVSRSSFSGYRDPEPVRDSLFVFFDDDEDTDADDTWVRAAITGVSTAAACPGAIGAGITLSTPNTPALVGMPVGTPVRLYEVMELKLHEADGKSWLGARSVSAGEVVVQPVLGPLADGNGFALSYADAAGVATANRTAIKSIQVTLRGISDGTINVGSNGSQTYVQEELVSRVALRNALRP
jgi:prepilin-type N-terminal cleavage/methylation domain-containing protein